MNVERRAVKNQAANLADIARIQDLAGLDTCDVLELREEMDRLFARVNQICQRLKDAGLMVGP